MTVVTPYLQKLEFIKRSLPRWATRAVLENADWIISILQDKQLSLGLNSNQQIVGRYAPTTATFYGDDPQKKPRTDKTAGDPYNFEWFGELFDSMNVKADTNRSEFDIFSSVGKIEELETIYGTKLGELTTQNNYIVNMEVVLPYLQQKILDNLVLI